MQSKDKRFIPTPEMWTRAQAIADKHSPRPALNSTVAAVSGFFGGGVVAMLALAIAGVDVEEYRGRQAVAVASAICALLGYLAARSREKAHDREFAKAIEEMENDWRDSQRED